MYPLYFSYFTRPVKILEAPDRVLVAWALDWDTGGWVPADELVTEILGATYQDVFRLTPQMFVDEVEGERGARLSGDAPVFALYETINSILDTAQSEDRIMTDEERALVTGLRRKTYRMFEEELRRRGDPAAEPELVDS